jgi:Beta-lactamase
MAAGGLWTTPTDLAKWALEITNTWRGSESKLFSKSIATEMLTVQKAPYGLGVELAGTGQSLEFSHGGSNSGFRAFVVMFPAVGKGAVIMANGDRADSVIGNLLTSITSEYHWPARMQTEREVVSLSNAQLDALVGVYSLPPGPSGAPVMYEVTREGNRLFTELKGLGSYPKGEIFPASATSFFSLVGLDVNFTLDSSARATSLKMGEIIGIRKQ